MSTSMRIAPSSATSRSLPSVTQGEDGVRAPKRRRRDGDNGASGGDGGGSGSSGGMAAAAAAEPAAAEAAATEPAAGEAAAAEPAVAGQAAAAAPWPPADPTVPPLTIVEGPTRASIHNCHGTGYNGFPITNAFWTIWATRCDQNPNDQYDMEPFKFPDNTPNGGPEDNIIVEIPARPGHPVVALEVAGLYSQANLDAPLPANFAEFDPRTREDYYSYVAEEAKEGSELRVQEVFDKGGDKRVFEDGKTLVAWGAYGTQHDFGRDQEEGWLDPQYTPALIQVSTDATIFKISLRGSNYMRGCAIFRCIQDDANPPASHAEPNRQRLHPRNFTAL